MSCLTHMNESERLTKESQSTQYVSQMTPGNTKKGKMTHWLVNLDTGPGLTFVSQLDSCLDMSGEGGGATVTYIWHRSKKLCPWKIKVTSHSL